MFLPESLKNLEIKDFIKALDNLPLEDLKDILRKNNIKGYTSSCDCPIYNLLSEIYPKRILSVSRIRIFYLLEDQTNYIVPTNSIYEFISRFDSHEFYEAESEFRTLPKQWCYIGSCS